MDRPPRPLNEVLADEAYRFEFFQAVRLLARLYPERAPLGHTDDPDRECVRFRSVISLAFPASDLASIDLEDGDEHPPLMSVAFMGAASPSSHGSLPTWYAELALEQAQKKDFALRDFLDLFNHRMISLFYLAWERQNFPIAFERSGGDRFERVLFSIMGLGTPGMRSRQSFDERALLRRSGLLSRPGIPAQGLEGLVRDYFRVPAEVVQFVPKWFDLNDNETTRLGDPARRLGDNVTIGSRVRIAQSTFRIRLGPLRWNDYQQFLPSGAGFRPLIELVRFAVGPTLEFEVQLVLAAVEVPPLLLGSGTGAVLGLSWSSWLDRSKIDDDASDTVIPSAGALATAGAGPARPD